ncbi:MAG: HD domain-containing protein [Methanothrix sp.]
MDGKGLSFCRKWFEDYTRGVHCQDSEIEKNILLKLAHTYRVRENIAIIARSLGMNEEDLALAEAIALFHDVGRFEQLRVYGTFNDRISADHSQIGLQVLNRSEVLSILPARDRNLIRKCIWHHNKYQLQASDKTDFLLFSRLIRDADKLDILGIILDHFETREQHPNQALDFGMVDESWISPEVISDVVQGRMVRIAGMRTLLDMRMMYLSWIFDIHFPFTLACIKENGYVERLLAGVPDDANSERAKDSLREYLQKRCEVYI